MFLFEMLVSMLTGKEGLFGFLIGLVMAIIMAFFAVLIVWAAYWAVDYVGADKVQGEAIVISKEFVPEHVVVEYNAALKTSMPRTVNDAWFIELERDGLTDTVAVKEDFYNSTNVNDWLTITYSTGRLSGGMRVTDIQE